VYTKIDLALVPVPKAMRRQSRRVTIDCKELEEVDMKGGASEGGCESEMFANAEGNML